MRIDNPNAPKANPITQADKDALAAVLVALAAKAQPSFDEIRAALAAGNRARFTDGVIHATALELGLTVIPE